ncbi:MAG: choice-of-anchor L domain-containing protein [Chitinophagales bacterium]
MKTLLTGVFALACIGAHAQLTVTASNNAATLAQSLEGNGVAISNAILTAANDAAGSFNANFNTNLGISNGIVLTTGRTSDVSKTANIGSSKIGASYDNGAIGDTLLQSLSGYPTYNASSLTFDVVPIGDKLTFRYVFMSEEYPNFVCANFNDVFGFFVNGPRPTQLGGGSYVNKNVAIVPNTNQPVGINTVNSGVSGPYSTTAGCQGFNTAYYRNNAGNAYVVYNGGTVVLTATVDVIPCATYTFKLSIADGNDEFYDSGVFIEAGSFTSNRATLSTAYAYNGYSAAYEGCANARVQFNFNPPYDSYNAFKYQISGTAINGVDYQHIPDSIIVPIGATSASVNIVPIADNLTEGSETMVISLVDACTQQPYTQASITINDTQHVSISAGKLQLCANESTVLTATGTVSYSWTPAAGLSTTNTAQTTATPSGTQTYVVTGTTGACVSTASVTLEQRNMLVNGTTNAAACGGAGGSINLSVSNGQPAYSFVWNDNNIQQNRSNVAAGNYTVTVTDATGCTQTANFTVGSNSQLQVNVAHADVSCFGAANGSATASVVGNGAYSFSWSNGGIGATQNNLAAGNYTVTVRDAGQCSAIANVVIQQPLAALDATFTKTDITCSGSNLGSAHIAVTGGQQPYTYTWNVANVSGAGSNTLTAGNYDVTITDANLCTAFVTFIIEDQTDLTVTATATNVVCNGGNNGAAVATATGGSGNYSYTWSNQAVSPGIQNLTAGNYTVTVLDANGCSATASAVLVQPQPLQINEQHTDVSCSLAGSIDIAVTGGNGGYSFAWNDMATSEDRTNIAAGNYAITVSDSKGCSATAAIIIGNSVNAVSISETIVPPLCHGGTGSVVLNSSGSNSATYTWADGATTKDRTQLSEGNYAVTVTDNVSGCTAVKAFTIAAPTAIAVNAVVNELNCTGNGNEGAITLHVNGGTPNYTYLWNDGVATKDRSNLNAGTYTVQVSDANGCTTVYSAVLQTVSSIQSSVQFTQPLCFGGNDGTASISVSGGDGNYSFIWSNNVSLSSSASNLTAGSYSITVTDGKGCTSVENFSIAQPARLQVTATPTPNVCFGVSDGAALLVATGGVSPLQYSVELLNSSSPINRVTGEFTELSAGSYIATVKDSNSCTATTNFTIAAARKDSLSFETKATTCFDEATKDGNVTAIILSTENGPYQFAYSNHNFTTETFFAEMAAGNYIFTSKNNSGCVVNHQVTVERAAEIVIELPADTLYAEAGQPTQLTATANNVSDAVMEWSAVSQPDYLDFSCSTCSQNAPVSTTPFTNEYQVKVYSSSNKGCFKTANIVVAVATEMVMPNAFTPNGDQVNDRIFPIFNNNNIKVTTYSIYNSWGQLVHGDITQGWDGDFGGINQPAGTYTYFISYERNNTAAGKTETITKSGSVTLLR